MTAGASGAFVGTPAEVSLIRMTSDGSLPKEQRRNYKSVFDAIIRIYRYLLSFKLLKLFCGLCHALFYDIIE